MHATIPEPLQHVVDHLSLPSIDISLPSIDLPKIGERDQHRSKKPLLLLLVVAAIVALVLMRRRGSSGETGGAGAGAPAAQDAEFADVR